MMRYTVDTALSENVKNLNLQYVISNYFCPSKKTALFQVCTMKISTIQGLTVMLFHYYTILNCMINFLDQNAGYVRAYSTGNKYLHSYIPIHSSNTFL